MISRGPEDTRATACGRIGGALRSVGHALTLVAGLLACAAAGAAQDAVSLPALRANGVLIHYWPGGERLAEALLAPAGVLAPLPGLPPDILTGDPPVRVYLAPDPARFDSLTGGRTPEWGAGVAFPDAGVIVLPGYGSDRGGTTELPRVLRHELAHIALHRYLDPLRVPRWFTEGYATWAAGQLDTDAAWLLRLAFVTERAPPLDSLALQWPAGEVDARVAYLLSATAIAYLHEKGGDPALAAFLAQWKQTGDFDVALRAVYGITFGQFERFWSRSVRRRYGWVLFLAQSVVIWLIVGLLVVVLYLIRRRRKRLRLAQLRANELPDDPAYWLEEPRAEGTNSV